MKKIVLLGATGSIGTQTVEVVKDHSDLFEIVAMSCGKNIVKLKELLGKVDCKYLCVQNEEDVEVLKADYPDKEIYWGDEGLMKLAQLETYDVLMNALVGFAGLKPTMAAISHKKDIALANKETLVVAGLFVTKACKEHGVALLPVDSEHSAIFQALQGNKHSEINKLIITASGGAFRNKSRDELEDVTVQQALAHPNWSMGAKITIDSATMMNKGFEVIEAHWLFDIPFNQIEVVMHRESIIHSMVEYVDHSIMAQMAGPNMELPIQYAFSYPDRLTTSIIEPLDLVKAGCLHFEKMDMERFPLLKLAYEIGEKQGLLPAVLNAANEEANLAFRQGKIKFLRIEELIFDAVNACENREATCIEDLFEADAWARDYVKKCLEA
ncbi:MAG: 1-deoxy-D-xylulose-5-phosphate reductoisomerase [Erysipelotrichaceae bacterium]|nr:1-deoxy-D-xylulose-5-phosphate reductoisomerase [Erysipelotrichaceae bacterium]